MEICKEIVGAGMAIADAAQMPLTSENTASLRDAAEGLAALCDRVEEAYAATEAAVIRDAALLAQLAEKPLDSADAESVTRLADQIAENAAALGEMAT